MGKTSVLKAPYDAQGSLLHYPSDGRVFSHYESDAGERLERAQVFETIPAHLDDAGQWHRYTERWLRDDWRIVYTEPVWRDNEPFHATLQISHLMRGRSAKYVILEPVSAPTDPRRYPIFVADLVDIACTGAIQRGGIISGRWMVAKRGSNYGLRFAKEDE